MKYKRKVRNITSIPLILALDSEINRLHATGKKYCHQNVNINMVVEITPYAKRSIY